MKIEVIISNIYVICIDEKKMWLYQLCSSKLFKRQGGPPQLVVVLVLVRMSVHDTYLVFWVIPKRKLCLADLNKCVSVTPHTNAAQTL